MHEALKEAHKALAVSEVPIGCVIVARDTVIGRGHNMTESLNDVTAHAEMIAITAAEQKIGKYLEDCTLYVTVEPCLMCAGAIAWSHIGRVVYGASDKQKGYSVIVKPGHKVFHPKTPVIHGVLENECRDLMLAFFAMKRK